MLRHQETCRHQRVNHLNQLRCLVFCRKWSYQVYKQEKLRTVIFQLYSMPGTTLLWSSILLLWKITDKTCQKRNKSQLARTTQSKILHLLCPARKYLVSGSAEHRRYLITFQILQMPSFNRKELRFLMSKKTLSKKCWVQVCKLRRISSTKSSLRIRSLTMTRYLNLLLDLDSKSFKFFPPSW